MKWRRTLAGLCLAVLMTATGNQAHAQFSITITVDENGNGTLVNTNNFNSPLPSALLQDPGPGGLPGALTYGLLNPPGLVAGDLIMLEPGTLGVVSDLIRFNPNQTAPGLGTGTMVFYSDNVDGKDSLADIGFPTALYANTATVVEVGPEGVNGFSYTPTAGMPGFVAGAGGPVTYVIHSDLPSVPEPGALALGAFASCVGLAVAWRRRRRAAA
jgi:hypothetical protein